MDIDKLAEAIISRIEHDRAIHKSSLVEEIQRAMKAPWSATPPMPSMVELKRQVLSELFGFKVDSLDVGTTAFAGDTVTTTSVARYDFATDEMVLGPATVAITRL